MLAVVPVVSAQSAGSKTVLTVWDWWSQADPKTKAFFDWVKTTFEERNPGVEVHYQVYGFGEYVDKILTASAAGVGPDVIAMSVLFAWDLWDKGVLADLTTRIDADPSFAKDLFIPSTQVYNRRNGHVIGSPWYIDTANLYYNAQHFREAAIDDTPFALETWDDFAKAAKKLTRWDGNELKRAGYQMWPWSGFTGLQAYASWLASDGESFYNSDFTAVNFNNPAGLETLQFLTNLKHESRASANYPDAQFIDGTASIVDWHTGATTYIGQAAPEIDLRMTNFPQGPSGSKRGTMSWGNMLGILDTSKHKDLAWKYVAFATSLETNIAMLTKMDRPTAPRLAFYQSDEWADAVKDNPLFAVVPDIVYSSAAYTYPFWGQPVLTTDVAKQFMGAVQTAEIPPKQAITEATRLLNGVLAEKSK